MCYAALKSTSLVSVINWAGQTCCNQERKVVHIKIVFEENRTGVQGESDEFQLTSLHASCVCWLQTCLSVGK